MTDVRYSPTARRDIERAHAFYAQADTGLALMIVERIIAAGRVLGDTPRAGPLTGRAGERRKWLVPRTPYQLIYRIEQDHVRVIRVLHTARGIAGA